MKNFFAHKTAEIDQNCIIGEGTKNLAFLSYYVRI